jgi:serine phosphatase RsbU (regulator of sigma subunit)
MLGDACEGGIEAALATAALRAALRADDGRRLPDPEELLTRANRILWESTAGGWWGGLWLGQLDLNKGRCDYVSAGRPMSLWLRPDGWASLAKPCAPLGLEPVIAWERKQLTLSPGESLFVCNRNIAETSNQYGMPLGEIALSRALRNELAAPPERMIEIVRDLLETYAPQPIQRDRSILIVKRLPA